MKFESKVVRPKLILSLVSALFLQPVALWAQGTGSGSKGQDGPAHITGVVPPKLIFTNSGKDDGTSPLIVTPSYINADQKRYSEGELKAAAPSTAAPHAAVSSTAADTTAADSVEAAPKSAGKLIVSGDNPSSTPAAASTAEADRRKVAQWVGAPDPNRRNTIPTVTGTVKIRKPFKIFVREELIHNLSFRETPIREVIAEIARRGNLNIILDKSVQGKVTGELRDVTLNEAMDSVLAAAGLQSRVLDNSTVVVATTQAMVQLGLNRSTAKAFKLSYAHPYDVAMILNASVFNKGVIPDFTKRLSTRNSNDNADESETSRENGAGQEGPAGKQSETTRGRSSGGEKDINESENQQVSRPDNPRTVRGSSRSQTQEGVGFNNAALDPGSQQVRAYQEVNTDYIVDQNGGGTIVIPDVKNRQVVVVGTVEEIALAEESIRLLDRRPRQVHIQTSLIELSNQGIRQLGANLALQGQGASGTLLGNQAAPLIANLSGIGNGLVGYVTPTVTPIAGLQAAPASQSGFNFLTLGRSAGGKGNIGTVPAALSVNLNLLLQTNKAKVIANPSIVVVDNTEALVTIAQEVVHKVTSTVSLGVVTTNVELTKAGVFLNVLPRIAQDGFITMRLRPQVSSPIGSPLIFGSGASPTVVTLLSIRDILSQEVRVKDGQSLVLGGLFEEQETAQIAKIPYAAEMPILGAFVRNTLKGRNRTELMLLITPKIVEEDPQAVSEVAPGPTM
jgi:type II secretory pathway component GspD/PulD (secretin)